MTDLNLGRIDYIIDGQNIHSRCNQPPSGWKNNEREEFPVSGIFYNFAADARFVAAVEEEQSRIAAAMKSDSSS